MLLPVSVKCQHRTVNRAHVLRLHGQGQQHREQGEMAANDTFSPFYFFYNYSEHRTVPSGVLVRQTPLVHFTVEKKGITNS